MRIQLGLRLIVVANLICGTASAAIMGGNKFELLQQYEGFASGADGSPSYQDMETAMARKSIEDGASIGLKFFRVAVAGWGGFDQRTAKQDMLHEWMDHPEKYWSRIDMMFNDLDAANVKIIPNFIWNIAQFPALADESVSDMIKNPKSKSRELSKQYIMDFILRYRNRNSILFYDLTNEANMLADLDMVARCRQGKTAGYPSCSVWRGNFSTDDLIEFSRDMVGFVKAIDSARPVSSGYSLPRDSAAHLRLRPEGGPKGSDWSPDTEEEFVRYIKDTHKYFDIVSVHLYPSGIKERFPSSGNSLQHFLTQTVGEISGENGKPVFIGEFGIEEPAFRKTFLESLGQSKVAFAAFWTWQFAPMMKELRPPVTLPAESLDLAGPQDALDDIVNLGRLSVRNDSTPRIVLTWPLPCAKISGKIEMNAIATTGAFNVPSVEFLLNDHVLGAVDKPPFSLIADAPALQGVFQLQAVVKSPSGESAIYQIPLIFGDKATDCPQVSYH